MMTQKEKVKCIMLQGWSLLQHRVFQASEIDTSEIALMVPILFMWLIP